MRDDDQLEPSLPLARHENAHREHEKHQNHALRHQHYHREATATAEASVVTEVTATISVVQQIDVDSNGNTICVITVPQTSSNEYPAVLTDSPSPTTISSTAAASSNAASEAASTALDTPAETSSFSPSCLSSSSLSASAASTSTPSTSASCSSITVGSNSTILISSSSCLSNDLANSTCFSSSTSSSLSARTSLTYLTSSSSLSTSYDVSLTTTLVSSSSSSSASRSVSFQSTSTGAFGGVVGGTAVASGSAASSAAASVNGNDSNSGSPVSTRAVVGGVVGSVAGVAVIALLLLFLIKWRKNPNGALVSLGSGRDGTDAMTRGPSQASGGMVERRSFAYAVPAALASLTGFNRSSRQTDQTVSSTGASERGFYRVSGRKLPSVLQTGGDGYGGGVPDDHTLSGSSFYRDSHGFYGGPASPSFPVETHRERGQIGSPVMRPSPARTPVTEQGPFSTAGPPDLNPLSPRRDVLGRSHPSQDGSHASRFTEEV